MEKTNFWNDAAKYGAIIGALLSVSTIVETGIVFTGNISLYALMLVEWVAVVVGHYYLLHRFTKQQSSKYTEDEGFTFGQAYSYILIMSVFAGGIVGVVQYIYLHLIIGYSNYVDKIVAVLTDVVSRNGGMPASMEMPFAQVLSQLQESVIPSVLATVWNAVFFSLLFGAIFGLIIAGVLSRASKPFGGENNA